MSRIVIGLWASLFLLAAQDVGATEKEVQEELTQLGTLGRCPTRTGLQLAKTAQRGIARHSLPAVLLKTDP